MNKKEFRDDAFETIRELMRGGESKDEIKNQNLFFLLFGLNGLNE